MCKYVEIACFTIYVFIRFNNQSSFFTFYAFLEHDGYTPCPKKIVPFFLFFFLGAQCVESGVICTDCY